MLRGAIFDMDGTILDSMSIWSACGDECLKSLGIDTGGELQRSVHGIEIAGVAKLALEQYDLKVSHDELVELMWQCIDDGYGRKAMLKDGVEELLSRLYISGIPMVLATATDRKYVDLALNRLDIEKYFCDILTCKEIGMGKDNPRIFDMAHSALGTEKHETYIFEDSLHAIVTAKNNGFYVVGVQDEYSSADEPRIRALSDYYLKNFSDWPTVLAPILA